MLLSQGVAEVLKKGKFKFSSLLLCLPECHNSQFNQVDLYITSYIPESVSSNWRIITHISLITWGGVLLKASEYNYFSILSNSSASLIIFWKVFSVEAPSCFSPHSF